MQANQLEHVYLNKIYTNWLIQKKKVKQSLNYNTSSYINYNITSNTSQKSFTTFFQSDHQPVPTHMPAFRYHNTTATRLERVMCCLWDSWSQPTTSLAPPHQTACPITIYLKESAIYPLPHTWAQRYSWLASGGVTDRGVRLCHLFHPRKHGQA